MYRNWGLPTNSILFLVHYFWKTWFLHSCVICSWRLHFKRSHSESFLVKIIGSWNFLRDHVKEIIQRKYETYKIWCEIHKVTPIEDRQICLIFGSLKSLHTNLYSLVQIRNERHCWLIAVFYQSKMPYTQYMADKSDKFGIKFWLADDAESKYLISGVPYLIKDESRQADEAFSAVLRLIDPYVDKCEMLQQTSYNP